ncbi:hypothetical protein DH2020_016384 [Rehmannia glutinosa]|uniref:Zinc finger BED domain-containing protein n=1 Tax=Rehmannia glutinosa TaxID=99300 RepID=A0ABR0WR86_REHGL
MADNSVSSQVGSNEIENETETLPYSHELMIKKITRCTISLGLSLNQIATPSFVPFMKALNPHYELIDHRDVIKEAIKEFADLKKELLSTFASLSHRVALACDVWRNENELDFIRITAHWIDSDWSMQRRIINFKMLDFPCAASISDPVVKSLDAWGIKDKTFSLTVDDVCDNADAVGEIKNAVHPILDGKLFRVRCVNRVLSLCILDGLDLVNEMLTKIRNGFGKPVFNPESYISLCEKYGLKPKYNMFDDGYNWDSTLEMLKRCMPYKDVLNEFIARHWPDEKSDEITEQDWEVASIYIRFLNVFYEAVDCISSNYCPTSSGVLLQLVNIAKLFSEYRGSVMFEEKFLPMEEKFLKHYDKIPDLFCLATVMDPRIKLSGCECLLESFYQCTDNTKVNLEEEKKEISNLLHEMYNVYTSQSSEKQQPSSEPSASFRTSDFAWSLISQKKRKTENPAFNELTFYLESPHVFEEYFDLLTWWESHELMYPVLATMARDLLTTPASTLAPDCAFMRNVEKKIKDKSYHLNGAFLEIYTCLRDWFNAELGSQGDREPYDEEEMCCEFDDQEIPVHEELEDP